MSDEFEKFMKDAGVDLPAAVGALKVAFEADKKSAEALCKKWSLEADANKRAVAGLAAHKLVVHSIRRSIDAIDPQSVEARANYTAKVFSITVRTLFADLLAEPGIDEVPCMLSAVLESYADQKDNIASATILLAALLCGGDPQHDADNARTVCEAITTALADMRKSNAKKP